MAKILLADDERDVVTLLKFLLEKDGHLVEEAFNGEEVLTKLGVDSGTPPVFEPDLIVLDVMMPQLDGYSVARRLANEDKTRRIPVIILTAKGKMRDLFDTCPNVARYMEKPFDPSNLREAVKKTLQERA